LILLTLISLVSIMVPISVDFDIFEVTSCQEFHPVLLEDDRLELRAAFRRRFGFAAILSYARSEIEQLDRSNES